MEFVKYGKVILVNFPEKDIFKENSVYVAFEEEKSVRALLDECKDDSDRLYYNFRLFKNNPIEVCNKIDFQKNNLLNINFI